MFGNTAKGLTLVYQYGCKAPAEGDLKIALDEVYLRNRLWNQLVELERTFRASRDSLVVSDIDRQIEAVQERITELSRSLKTLKANAAYSTIVMGRDVHEAKDILKRLQTLLNEHQLLEPAPTKRYRSIPALFFESVQEMCSIEELKQAITFLREQAKPLYTLAKQERKKLFIANHEQIKELEATRVAAVKEARQTSGLYWGNYNDVIASYETARVKALKEWATLHFHAYDSSGKITVQFIKPLTPKEAFGNNGQFQLDPVPESAWDTSLGRARKKQQWTTLKIRIRSGEKKAPIWLTMPVCLHRPIPADATLQMASIIRHKVGLDWKYELLITLRLPEPQATRKKKVAVVRFCSQMQDDRSLKIGTIEAAGKVTQISLPKKITERFETLDNLRAIQDQYQAKAQKAISNLRETAPQWFQDATQHAHSWRKASHYFALLQEWAANRFNGDIEAFATVNKFRERYFYLYPWEANLRDKLFARRKDLYRNLAANLVKQFGIIQLEQLAKTKPKQAESESQELQNKRYWRRAPALYDLQTIIKNTARRTGVTVCLFADTEMASVA